MRPVLVIAGTAALVASMAAVPGPVDRNLLFRPSAASRFLGPGPP